MTVQAVVATPTISAPASQHPPTRMHFHTLSPLSPRHVDEVGGEGHVHVLARSLTQTLLNLGHVAVLAHAAHTHVGLEG